MTTKLVASTPPDLQTLLNFEKKRQTEVEGAIGAATIKDREGFVPQADPTDTGIFSSPGEISARDALNKAAESAGLLTPEGAGAISDTVQEWLAPAEFDPNFKLTDLEADPKNAAFLKETFGRRDAMDTRFHEALAGAANREVAQSMINDYVNDRQRFEDASGAGLAVEMLGGAVGATRDIVMTAPFLWGGATAARAMTEIAGKALELGIVTSGEAALAYAERVVRGQRDYTIDGHTEGLISAAFAGGLTFGVGAFAFRKSAASSLAKALEEGRLAETLQTQQPGGGTVSAQAAPVDERGVVLQKTGSTLLARFFFQKLRSPKGRVQDVGADVAQRVANDAPGSNAELQAHQILDELLGPEIDRVDPSGQAVVRTKSLEDAFDEARTIDGIMQKTVRLAHLDLDKAMKARKRGLSFENFDEVVYNTIQARMRGVDPEDAIIFKQELRDVFSPEELKQIKAAAAASADIMGEFTQAYGKRAVKAGMLTEDQIVQHYVPIIPKIGQIGTRQEYKEYFIHVFSNPSKENVDEFFPGTMADGETFADLRARDPELAAEIVDELDARQVRALGDRAFERRVKSEDQLEAYIKTAVGNIQKRMEKEVGELEAAFKKARGANRAKIKAELDELRTKVNDLGDGTDLAKMREIINDVGSKAQKARLRRMWTAVRKATKSENRTARAEPIEQRAAALADKIVSGQLPGGMVDDVLTARIGLTKDRVIEHDFEHPLFRQLFETRATAGLSRHARQMSPRLHLFERFGAQRKGLDVEGVATEDVAEVPVRLMREQAADAPADSAKRIDDMAQFADDVIKAALNLDRIPKSEAAATFDFWSQQVAKFNTASMLKLLGITQITDLALALARGRTLQSGVMGIFSSRKTARLVRDAMKQGHVDVVRIIEGPEIMGMRNPLEDLTALWQPNQRLYDMYGVDADDLMARTRLQNVVERGLDATNGIAGWLSFAAPMNMVLRRAMGADTARMMIDDWTGWAKLAPDIKARWQKYGIDDNIAASAADWINGPNGKITINGVTFPNFRGLREVDPELAETLIGASNRLGGEIFPAVTPFSKPLVSRTPLGRLALQFTSFAYAVGATVLPELKREARTPHHYRFMALTLGGIMAAMTSLFIRSAFYGPERFDETWDQLQTNVGRVQFAQRAALMMPLMPGMSSTLIEVMAQTYGPAVNAALGDDYLLASPSRFMRTGENVITRLGGPTVTNLTRIAGMAMQTGTAARKAAEGDPVGATETLGKAGLKFMHMMPLIDSLPSRGVISGLQIYER